MKFILDNNFILDIVTRRKTIPACYFKMIYALIDNGMAFMSSSQIHNLRYVVKKHYPKYEQDYLKIESKLKIVKTPAYIDTENMLAQIDIEDYLIHLSAVAEDAWIITSDGVFLQQSEKAIKPVIAINLLLQHFSNQKVSFLPLKKINNAHQPNLDKAVDRVLASGWYLLGNEVKAFEKEYAEFIGTKHCIGVGNGLDALRLILRAFMELGVMQEGDEIVVPANTYIASILAITDNRLTPILVEPDINTYNIDPYKIEEVITPRTKGVMIVHLYGRCAMHPEIERIVNKYNLKLIEDNAQAVGAYYIAEGRTGYVLPQQHTLPQPLSRTGSLGHAAGHSFYPGKNLGALGDSGAVTTNDDQMAEIIRALANYGSKQKYINLYQGFNSRLDEIQAAFLREKLKHIDQENQHRREIAEYYCRNIKKPVIILPCDPNFSLFTFNFSLSNVWHLFVIRTSKRDNLQKHLADHNIQTLIHYPIPPHKQQAYKQWSSKSLPVTEKTHDEVLSLPISPVLSEPEIIKIVKTINSI